MSDLGVPNLELLDMLQLNDRARVIFAEINSIEEIDIDRSGNDAMRG
jgi:hypothetical protein